jgi:adenylyltransferase/sulfurtransferase
MHGQDAHATGSRYHRQTLLPQIGSSGQARLAAARVLLVGCGALGTVIAEQLVRAGAGFLRIVDRDIVELTNLQRQVLFDEADVREQTPKAVAAFNRLRQINSAIAIEPVVADVHSGNVEELAGIAPGQKPVNLILDGTDSVETRYLLNDVSVKHAVPWIYGACVGTVGRAMAFLPPTTACLRCVFPAPMGVGELPTCDTAGVFSPVPAVVASLQVSAALKILVGQPSAAGQHLFMVNLWENQLRAVCADDSKRDDCVACGVRRYEFLDHRASSATTSLCGRNSVQVRPATGAKLDLDQLAGKLRNAGDVERTPHLLRCRLQTGALDLTVFPDGRLIVQGTNDKERARSVYAKFIGA